MGAEPTLQLATDTIAPYGQVVVVGLAEGTLPFSRRDAANGAPRGGPGPSNRTAAPVPICTRSFGWRSARRSRSPRSRHPLADAPRVMGAARSRQDRRRAVLIP